MSPESLMILAVALLSLYLFSLLASKYVVRHKFMLTRITVTAFVLTMFTMLFIVYWQYVVTYAFEASLALLLGTFVGRMLAVEVEKHKISEKGLSEYVDHYLHIHVKSLDKLEWWSIINVHTIIVTLVLVNLMGLSELVYPSEAWVLSVIVTANFLVGTTIPYMLHLWTIKAPHHHGHKKSH